MRADLEIIQEWIPAGSRVLDLGCGDGELLTWLRDNKQVTGYGLENDADNIAQCVAKGINVIEQDLDKGLGNFASNSFDVVVMTQALQAVHYPDKILDEMLRVGRQCIITFPNFGHWRCRWYLASKGRMPVSEFLLYFGAASGFAQWVTGLMEQFALLRKQSLDISTIREFLELPEPFRFEEGIPLEKRLDMPYELQLEDVSYRYPGAEKNTIAHMSLTLHPGENLAIVGLNGAGKTTLVKLICGFLDPTGGRVLLNGQDIRQYNRRDYYKLFEAVFQDFSVLSCTVAENVAQAMDGIRHVCHDPH